MRPRPAKEGTPLSWLCRKMDLTEQVPHRPGLRASAGGWARGNLHPGRSDRTPVHWSRCRHQSPLTPPRNDYGSRNQAAYLNNPNGRDRGSTPRLSKLRQLVHPLSVHDGSPKPELPHKSTPRDAPLYAQGYLVERQTLQPKRPTLPGDEDLQQFCRDYHQGRLLTWNIAGNDPGLPPSVQLGIKDRRAVTPRTPLADPAEPRIAPARHCYVRKHTRYFTMETDSTNHIQIKSAPTFEQI